MKLPATSHNRLAPSLNYIDTRSRIKFDGQCLKQDKHLLIKNQLIFILSMR